MSQDSRKVVVLGAGMVGAAIAADLGDADAVRRLAREHELVVGALPSALGFRTLRTVIEAGRDVVDISFMPEDALELSALAHDRGVTAVVDCGVAPGVSNMMAGDAVRRLGSCEWIEILVGGLPVARHWPFQYKAGFAPSDVLEEYTRPARVVENGRVVVKEPLSESELVEFPGIGTLEAFTTDGLRSLVATLSVPYMKEKTLRWPGHAELMRVLRAAGFFSLEALEVGGQQVRPRDLTAALLFPKWTFEEGEADLTVMRVRARGTTGGRPTECVWDLVDRFDEATGLRSMSRTTGFAASAVARLLARQRFRQPGVHAPERLGERPALLAQVLDDLRARGVRCQQTTRAL